MKKLALLLGALTLVSGAAYAKEVVPVVEEVAVVEEAPVTAPTLTVRYVGQGLEIDNTSGDKADIGEDVMLSQHIGLAYGDDWTFDLMARKSWLMDTDDGIHSNGNYRIDLDAWRHFDNYSLGFRWRQQNNMDRYYLRTKYAYGMFSGNIDVAYQSNNGGNGTTDAYYVEMMPVKLTVGPVTLGYYFEADTWGIDTKESDGFEHKYRQQLRVSAPIYTGEKLSLGLEYRWQFDTDVEYDEKYATKGWDEEDVNHIVVLSANYAVTENLSVGGYYQYEMREWNSYNADGSRADKDKADNYYGEFFVGWTYTF